MEHNPHSGSQALGPSLKGPKLRLGPVMFPQEGAGPAAAGNE
jgi:hypothetical protein